MTTALVQKILASIAVLTTLYLLLIFKAHNDLTRKLSNSVFHLLPGLLFFGIGIGAVNLFDHPDFIFRTIFSIKSGFAKSLLSGIIFPLLGVSIRTMSFIAGFSCLIDKMWFYWLQWRIHYLIRLIAIIILGIIAGNTLFKIIFVTDKDAINLTIQKLNTITYWSSITLGAITALLTLPIIARLFTKRPPIVPD